MPGVMKNKSGYFISCLFVAVVTVCLLASLQYIYGISYVQTKSFSGYMGIIRFNKQSSETPGYLGCYLLTTEEISYHNATSREMDTLYDCISYCQSTSHMYSYYKRLSKECSCDNLFYTRGLGSLPCGSDIAQSADVYYTSNISQTKYNLLNRNWKQGECNCVGGLCSTLNCSNSKQICYVGPKAEFLQEVKGSKCNHTTVEPFYNEESRPQYCVNSLNGFLPARCESWKSKNLGLDDSRFYRMHAEMTRGNPMIPLTPVLNQKKVLLLTHMRSGSTFLSEFFKGYPNSYYMYEPLHGLTSEAVYSAHEGKIFHEIDKRSIELLDRSFRCDLDLVSGMSINYPNRKFERFFSECELTNADSRLSCVQAHYSSCQSSNMIAIKTIRARLDWARQLLVTTHQGLKIVYLVRDPRGIINSRMGMPGHPKYSQDFHQRAKSLCGAMLENYATAKLLKKSKYKDQVLVIRYEDVVTDNVKAAKYIYKSLSLGEVPKSLISRIRSLTDITEEIPKTYNTKRKDSLKTAYRWKQTMDYRIIKMVDSACIEAYRLFGYLPIDSIQQLREEKTLHIQPKHNFFS